MHFTKLIVVALKPEWSFLKQDYPFQKKSDGPLLYSLSQIPAIGLLQTGVGLERTATSFENFLSQHTVDHILHMGTCGALNPNLQCGDLFVSQTVINSEEKNIRIPVFKDLLEHLKNSGVPAHTGMTLCAQQVLKNSAEKKAAHERFLADTVDMESVAVAKICQNLGISYLNVRGVFDRADEDLADMARSHTAAGNLSPAGLMADLIASPKLVLKLPEMQKRLMLIQKNLLVVVRWLFTSNHHNLIRP